MERSQTSPSVVKRPRPVLSCLVCRRKKLRCDRKLPCNQCLKIFQPSHCQYAEGQEPEPRVIETSSLTPRVPSLSTNTSEVSSGESSSTVPLSLLEDLQARIRKLEAAAQGQEIPSDNAVGISGPRISNDYLEIPQRRLLDRFPAAKSFVDGLSTQQDHPSLLTLSNELRDLQSALQCPSMVEATKYNDRIELLEKVRTLVPDADTCIILIDLYFEYFENCVRILHRQSFYTQFDDLRRGQLDHVSQVKFIPLLLAVISISASLEILPQCIQPRVHGQEDGIGAYQLLRNWMQIQTPKDWCQLEIMQLAVLTLRPHKSCPPNPTAQWQYSGVILRSLMAARIHVSMVDHPSLIHRELLRRIYFSTLELDLSFAVSAAMPANTPPLSGPLPLNINDFQLSDATTVLPSSSPSSSWTDTVCLHILAQSFNCRLEMYNSISFPPPVALSTLLTHTRQLEQIICDLPSIFAFRPSNPPHRLFAQVELDFFLRRPLSASYAPYGMVMPADDHLKEARIPWIQSITVSICYQDLFDPQFPMLDLPRPEGLWDAFYVASAWEVNHFMLANCLELQRLRELDMRGADVRTYETGRQEKVVAMSPAFTGHLLRSPARVLGWDAESMLRCIEQTIEPLSRRVGRLGSRLRDVVRWTVIIGSLRVASTEPKTVEKAIVNELQELLLGLRHRLKNEGSLGRVSREVSELTAVTESGDALKWLKAYLEQEDEHRED